MHKGKFALAVLLAFLGLMEVVQLWQLRDSVMSEVFRQFEQWSHQPMMLPAQGMAMLWAVLLFSLAGSMFEIADETEAVQS